jgi:F-type H+-transporting ATPase subunit delta
MPRPTTAPRRYAEAAFELATRDKAIDAWARDLQTAAALVGDERVARLLDDPSRPMAQRSALVDRLLGKRVRPAVTNLVRLLIERGRLDIIGAIADEFRRLVNAERGIVSAIITTAIPLKADETAAIDKRLRAMTGATVELQVQVDSALIGGLTVRIGDRLIDASVRGRLERLRDQLKSSGRPHGALGR